MRYLVKARVKSEKARVLVRAITNGTLGKGSIAGEEYLHDTEAWACCDCDCTKRLEERLAAQDEPFLESLRVRQRASS